MILPTALVETPGWSSEMLIWPHHSWTLMIHGLFPFAPSQGLLRVGLCDLPASCAGHLLIQLPPHSTLFPQLAFLPPKRSMLYAQPEKISPSLHPADIYPFFSPQLRHHFPDLLARPQFSVLHSDSARYISFITSVTMAVVHFFVQLFNKVCFPQTICATAAESGVGLREDQSNEKRKMIILGLLEKGSQAIISRVSAETQRQTEKWKRFRVEKREAFLCWKR